MQNVGSPSFKLVLQSCHFNKFHMKDSMHLQSHCRAHCIHLTLLLFLHAFPIVLLVYSYVMTSHSKNCLLSIISVSFKHFKVIIMSSFFSFLMWSHRFSQTSDCKSIYLLPSLLLIDGPFLIIFVTLGCAFFIISLYISSSGEIKLDMPALTRVSHML